METNSESTHLDVEDVSRDKLISDLKMVAHDAEELIKATASDLGEKGKDARVRLEATLEQVKTNYKKFQEKAAEQAKTADKVIREHPYESISIAFGLGLAFGILINRR